MKKVKSSFFVVGETSKSKESSDRKLYTGVGIFKIVALNPDKDKMQELLGYAPEKDPEYVSQKDGIRSVRLDFITETILEDGTPLRIPYRIYLRDKFPESQSTGSVQVIDQYGETGWVSRDDLAAQRVPEKCQRLIAPFRRCYSGEPELIALLKALLVVDDSTRYTDSKWVAKSGSELQKCVIALDSIESYFNGNWGELQEIIDLQPDNEFKALLGVGTTPEGNQFHQFYTSKPAKLRSQGVELFRKALAKETSARWDNIEFEVGPLKKYTPKGTSFSSESEEGQRATLSFLQENS